MNGLLNTISSREIVLWGVGAIQTDVENLFDFNVSYYVDDNYSQKKEIMPTLSRPIKPSSVFKDAQKKNVYIIVCVQEYRTVFSALSGLGYSEIEHFISYERLFYECDFINIIDCVHKRRIAFWGLGKTYGDYRKYLESYISDVSYLIDEAAVSNHSQTDEAAVLSHSQTDEAAVSNHSQTVDGAAVTFDQIKDELDDSYVIVTSSFYPLISEKLQAIGKEPVADYIFADTFRILNDYHRALDEEYTFADRRKDAEYLLIILAGYKTSLWSNVFNRVKTFLPADYDVCVLSSGLRDETLEQISAAFNWSYLSTTHNKISVIQNIAIHLHKSAVYVFKMDEDIFVTKYMFQGLIHAYSQVKKTSRYEIGFVSPLTPVNTYGYVRILEHLKLEDSWMASYGELKHSDGLSHHLEVKKNPKAARFLWGAKNDSLRYIDALAERMAESPFRYSICPSIYSIGMILFKKETWLDMKLFPVGEGSNLGADEGHLCVYCLMNARVIVVAENVLAGHLGYGPQTEDMMRYYEANERLFEITSCEK